MRGKGRIAQIVVIATALWVLDARADERKVEMDSSDGKSVADILREEKARVEGLSKEQRERQKRERENKKKKGFYGGLGLESYRPPLDAVYELRVTQRASVPIQHMEPVDDREELDQNSFTWNMYVGYEFTSWLGLEFTMHSMDSFDQWTTYTPARDQTLTHTSRVEAYQYAIFKERSYSLTAVPRWHVNNWLAVQGRLGLGLAENTLSAKLHTRGYTAVRRQCDADGTSNCRDIYDWQKTEWSNIDEKYSGIFPIAGLGLQLWDGLVNLEYFYRFNEPMVGDTTINHGSIYFRFMVRGRWF